MSILDFIHPPQQWQINDEEFDNILTVDVTLSEVYEFESEITAHPVEVGIDVVDHKRPKPIGLKMSGIITDSPNNALDVLAGNTTGLVGSEVDPSLGGNQRRSQEGYLTLIALYEQTTPLQVVTQRQTFANMLIRSLRVHKSDAGFYLGFDLELTELRFATTATVPVDVAPDVKPSALPQAGKLVQPRAVDLGGTMLEKSIEGLAPGTLR